MDRRKFLLSGTLTASGLLFFSSMPSYAQEVLLPDGRLKADDLYGIFKNPDMKYRPYVRWWWNGNKVNKEELARELQLLKDAGIGGVEVNPIAFPSKTDDMGIPSIDWLSDEWLDVFEFTLKKAKDLNMSCDLIVGTGFPFGGEFLEDKDRSRIAVIGVKKIEGPLNEEYSLFDLYKEADPAITNPFSGRTAKMLSVKLVPDPLNSMDDVKDLSDQIKNGTIKISIPRGKFALYALVEFAGFERVIVGAPGGRGPVVNHFSKDSVQKYLNRISERIKDKTGGFPSNFRSFFVDSMELEGANCTSGMLEEFKSRRGYDIFPYLPFILHKNGGMGNDYRPDYIVETGDELSEMLIRMRYDWALTNAEVFRESFVNTYAKWCTDNKVKSRAQAYGRGYFLLEGSFPIDIPECETWLKYGIGKNIPEDEYMKYPWHLGQGYTMINKYVSSAAHLKGKRLISSEELTNTDMVFNESLEIFKIAGDQSTISGVTQPVFHGFNYSPPDAPFPGWIRWGGYFNEKNTVWPYLHFYCDYRARLSALLQQGAMFAEIALLAPIPDMWGKLSAQNEPFPQYVYPKYQMLIWESIHQNGNACDYVSEQVINDAVIRNGLLTYGNRKYHTIFLIEVRGMNLPVIKKLHDFVSQGGRVFCIEAFPDHIPGWENHDNLDNEVKQWTEKLKGFTDRFILLKKPEENFCGWFGEVQKKYNLSPYLQIKQPERYITQVRYRMQDADAEVFFIINSSDSHQYNLEAGFQQTIYRNRQAWLWDAINGERHRLKLDNGKLNLAMGPATSFLIIFNKDKGNDYFQEAPSGAIATSINTDKPWKVQLQRYDGLLENIEMDALKDLKDIPAYTNFAGTIRYQNTFFADNPDKVKYLNLGIVYGISIVKINGKDAGVQWFGNRIYNVEGLLKKGENTIEVWVVTVMLNYMKTLTNNKVAQYWTNEGRKNQPLQSLGMAGPVSIY